MVRYNVNLSSNLILYTLLDFSSGFSLFAFTCLLARVRSPYMCPFILLRIQYIRLCIINTTKLNGNHNIKRIHIIWNGLMNTYSQPVYLSMSVYTNRNFLIHNEITTILICQKTDKRYFEHTCIRYAFKRFHCFAISPPCAPTCALLIYINLHTQN